VLQSAYAIGTRGIAARGGRMLHGNFRCAIDLRPILAPSSMSSIGKP